MTSIRRFPAPIVALLLFTTAAFGQFTWNGGGGDNNWSTAANWDGTGPANNFSTSFTFGGATRLTPNNDLTGGTITGLTFAGDAGAYTLGGNGVTASGGAWTNNSSNLQTVNNAVTLTGNVTYFGTASFADGGSVTQSGSNRALVNDLSSVDMADYVLWRHGGPLKNEGASIGKVDAADYTVWRQNFGYSSVNGSALSAGSNVPEPTGAVFLSRAALSFIAARRTVFQDRHGSNDRNSSS